MDIIEPIKAIGIVLAAMILFFQNHRQAKKVDETGRDLKKEVKVVNETLTENNGGSSVKDRFDLVDLQLRHQVETIGHLEYLLHNHMQKSDRRLNEFEHKFDDRVSSIVRAIENTDEKLTSHLDETGPILEALKEKGII